MTSGIWDVEAIRNCTHECEYAPPPPRLSTGPIYSDFPVARALQGRPHVRRSRAADEHRTPLQNDDRHPRGGNAYRHLRVRSRSASTLAVGQYAPRSKPALVTRTQLDIGTHEPSVHRRLVAQLSESLPSLAKAPMRSFKVWHALSNVPGGSCSRHRCSRSATAFPAASRTSRPLAVGKISFARPSDGSGWRSR